MTQRGRPRTGHEWALWYDVLWARWLLKFRHRDADERIAEAMRIGSAKTLRVALSRYRLALDPAERAQWDALEAHIDKCKLKCGSDLNETQVAERVDAAIATLLRRLADRRRLALRSKRSERSRSSAVIGRTRIVLPAR